ncbi:MAG: IS30 family transposase [Verrucomicrobiales bacterium VVV1]|nr:MAG: IS30 family transposase [Verrucomicrobiales bacterium VVV1]
MPEEIRHLRTEDRKIIARMKKDKKPQTEIARMIGFSQGTISKELSRNSGKRGYRPKQAQAKALERKAEKRARNSVMTEELADQVIVRLEAKHSPEQISGALALTGQRVSTSALYHHIGLDKKSGGHLHLNLRINGRRRYRRRNKASRVKIPNRRDISERPRVVERRTRHGDWEADLIEGSRGTGYILSLYERKSHYGKLIKLTGKSSAETSRGIIKALSNYRVETITYDNGLEFARHEEVSAALGSEGYFCKPYSSWEKGGVENFNGLVRQYYPKGCDLSKVSQSALDETEAEINDRPRKIHGYKSPSHYSPQLAA